MLAVTPLLMEEKRQGRLLSQAKERPPQLHRVPTKYWGCSPLCGDPLAIKMPKSVFVNTKSTGGGPEVGMYQYGGFNIVGMDEGRYPQTRSYTFSLALNF